MRLQYDDEFDLNVRLTFSGASRAAGGEPRRALPETVDEASCVPNTCRTCPTDCDQEAACVETNTCGTQCNNCTQTQCGTCTCDSCQTCGGATCDESGCGHTYEGTCRVDTCTCPTECGTHCVTCPNCND
jgi:hypothetical protein